MGPGIISTTAQPPPGNRTVPRVCPTGQQDRPVGLYGLIGVDGPYGGRLPKPVVGWAFAGELCFYCFTAGHDRLHCPASRHPEVEGGTTGCRNAGAVQAVVPLRVAVEAQLTCEGPAHHGLGQPPPYYSLSFPINTHCPTGLSAVWPHRQGKGTAAHNTPTRSPYTHTHVSHTSNTHAHTHLAPHAA